MTATDEHERRRVRDEQAATYDSARERASRFRGRKVVQVVCGRSGHRENQVLATAWSNAALGSLYCETSSQELDRQKDRQDALGWERRHTTDGKRATSPTVVRPYLLLGAPGADEIQILDAHCPKHGATEIDAGSVRDAAASGGRKPTRIVHAGSPNSAQR